MNTYTVIPATAWSSPRTWLDGQHIIASTQATTATQHSATAGGGTGQTFDFTANQSNVFSQATSYGALGETQTNDRTNEGGGEACFDELVEGVILKPDKLIIGEGHLELVDRGGSLRSFERLELLGVVGVGEADFRHRIHGGLTAGKCGIFPLDQP